VNRHDLQKRLIDFSVNVYHLTNGPFHSVFGKNLIHQLSRSTTSPSLNYAEAQSAESSKDFSHKMSIALKELRESYNILNILTNSGIVDCNESESLIKECNELISIFVSSIKTIQRNSNNS
jgi:four helix bundle protein